MDCYNGFLELFYNIDHMSVYVLFLVFPFCDISYVCFLDPKIPSAIFYVQAQGFTYAPLCCATLS